MAANQETHTSALRLRNSARLSQPEVIRLEPPEKVNPAENLLKNMAVAAALVLCAVTLRTGAIPQLTETTDLVLAAATDQSLLDEQLGKLSFVSALFPEAVLVFGEQGEDMSLPVSGGVISHEWSEEEPYMAWQTNQSLVTSAMDGEVMGVYHGNGDERIVQVMSDSGLTCLYGNLASAAVAAGDYVVAGDAIGELLPGEAFVFEVRREGMSVDPARYLGQ